MQLLILTEKPSVAKDFAAALNCTFYKGAYRNSNTIITNCIGHLFKEEPPQHYSNDFPVIPNHWDYRLPDDENLAKHAKFVISLLKQYKSTTIIIATDADREGEIIARECLIQAGITDISKIKRFWVSQALTKEVILEGLKNAKPLEEYNLLAKQGFARQHADWLVGMNFCRYISDAAKTKLSVGRVQTAILSAIKKRCDERENFTSKKYYQHYGIFRPTRVGSNIFCKGLYFDDKNRFDDKSNEQKLKDCIEKPAKLIESQSERKSKNPPQLYNLNAVQKDAFKFFGYSADKTLKIIQSLYEDLKCVSYPRTPSRVMGSANTTLCKNVADDLCKTYGNFEKARAQMNISVSNKKCFNDSKLEAHHALIPLKVLPKSATEEQTYIYDLILERFFLAFLPEEQYEKLTYILEVEKNKFKITGKNVLSPGWKSSELHNVFKYINFDRHVSVQVENEDDEQNLDNIKWNTLVLSDIETKEKWTRPPEYFNEASILSFMENPRDFLPEENETETRLIGLGTAATRHTFIPLLLKRGYIAIDKKNLICTELGALLLRAVKSSSIKELADVYTTTQWEEQLNLNPDVYMDDIKNYVREAVKQTVAIEVPRISSGISCPLCGKEVRKGKSNWYCSGYKAGCKFSLFETIAGAKLTEKDVIALCKGKQTEIKHCSNKAGKNFDCKFTLNENKQIKFVCK